MIPGDELQPFVAITYPHHQQPNRKCKDFVKGVAGRQLFPRMAKLPEAETLVSGAAGAFLMVLSRGSSAAAHPDDAHDNEDRHELQQDAQLHELL
ncbi:hypothetical protein CHELA20_52458 [Hyphomicrobiales bacterium]|nr:hypothetical protein CHELA20_52458 [Hyphomicrobiales bacterium]